MVEMNYMERIRLINGTRYVSIPKKLMPDGFSLRKDDFVRVRLSKVADEE